MINYILILTNMTQRKIITSSQPSILALKNIVSKVKDELSMRNLTIAIRQHCLEEQQTHLKDNYLRFFLKCESQLERNTNAEWNKVINQEIRRIVGSQKLFIFISLKTYRISFEKIKSYAKLDESAKIQQKICEEFEELKDIQISEEVRVKTKYFFKWCQFISEKNEIKKMKNKQIQDLKKSKIFNQYSSKFGSFMKWKQYVRRIKFIKSKAVQLQNKTKTKKIQQIFTQIKEKIEIISIQKMLELAVVNKLQSLGLKSVFNKLKTNKLKEQYYSSKLKKKPNIWLYRFYAELKKRSKPLQNKSSIQSRLQIEDEYKKLCKLTCWKGLKMKVIQTKTKISSIRLASKIIGFKQFKRQAVFQKQTRRKRKQFIKLYKAILLNSFIHAYKSTLEDKSQSKNQERSVVKTLVKSYFKTFKTNVFQKKRVESELDQSLKIVKLKLQSVKKMTFLRSLRGIKQGRVEFFNKGTLLRKKTVFNFFVRSYKAFQQWKQQQKQTRNFFLTKRNNRLTKLSFIGLKAYKKVKIGEYQTFNSIFNLFDAKIKSQVFLCLKQRNQTSKRIDKLIKASEYVTLKVSFITILNKMLSKKMKIKSFCTRKDTQLKRMLFDMLLKNSEHLHESTMQAHQFYKKMIKKEFIHNLSQQVQQTFKKNAMLKKIQQNKKKIIYNRFKQKQLKAEMVQESYSYLSNIVKANKFYEFYNSSKQLVDYRLEQERKSIKVEKTIFKGYFKRMRQFLKERKQRIVQNQQINCHFASLINQVQLNLTKKALKIMLRQTQTSLNKRFQLLGKVKKQEFINLLRFNKNNKEMKCQNKILRFNEILSTISSKCQIQQKRMRLMNFLKLQKSKNMFFTFRNNVQFDVEQRQSKQLQLKNYLSDFRLHQFKKNLVSKIKKHYEMKQNCLILCNRIASLGLKAFMTGYLDKKSKQLKQLAALKHYASNVKRRGMRALKYSINISLLKENRAKTENYSKILIEKSMDNARKKSKLMQTIERYNMSRVSRVLR